MEDGRADIDLRSDRRLRRVELGGKGDDDEEEADQSPGRAADEEVETFPALRHHGAIGSGDMPAASRAIRPKYAVARPESRVAEAVGCFSHAAACKILLVEPADIGLPV